ncbi:ubiquitin-conjugating enzyme E2 T-like [Saccoglossus kowalevskii]|uniref:Ubiquitin-conjugating enzyme E2 T-like n=1 Tax=Saccoglossus kowalevskii TaxID=10224 RepID=A0ABM0GMQ9_SACKO|nr:PREDICTED: ubiquitin-conjugating enzyme E2 T-like [Saccoglossus kowalevskii]
MQRATRMKREVQLLEQEPPHGISCWLKKDKIDELEAQIIGSEDTPYKGGIFKLEIQVPERYPFEPPKVRFVTPIYHPNIDNGGRICLDIIKMPPGGSWKPSLNISTVLKSIQLLMADPNPDDPLMAEISNEYKYNRPQFIQNAQQWTRQHAVIGVQASGKSMEKNKAHKSNVTESESESDSDDSDSDVTKLLKRKSQPCNSVQPFSKLSRSETK